MIDTPSVSASAQDISRPTIDAYASLPSFSDAQLSPAGQRIAYFVENNGKRNLVIGNVDGSEPLLVAPPDKQTFVHFTWKDDTTLIYTTSLSLKRRSLMVRTTETRLYRLDLISGKTRWLGTPVRTNFQETEGQHERILSLLPHDPDHILIELDLNRSGTYEVYKVNLNSSHRKLVQREQDGIHHWVADAEGNIRLAAGILGKTQVSRMKTPDQDWVNVHEQSWSPRFKIEGFTDNPKIIYASGINELGFRSLYTLNTQTGAVVDTLFSHDSIDMDHVIISSNTSKIIGVAYTDHFQRIVYFDKTLMKIQRSIDRALPDSMNTILSISSDRTRYFIFVHDARNPGDYYIYNRPEGTLSYVAPVRVQIDPERSANTLPVIIPMSDNTEIQGYITIPNEASKPENLPAVIIPHGGPFGIRDDATWDYEAQFYASRGYLVLKPNFRGSSGYGAAFVRAGFNQWGGRMQKDLSDATRWLIKQGYANSSRICIIGNSYGGYAALMGAILDPELYKCAASINGVTDLPRMKGSDRIYTVGGRAWSQHWGLEGADDRAISPYHRAEDINVPVLLIASQDNARIPFRFSEDMHQKLTKLDKVSKFVQIKNGTHNMATTAARRTMLLHIEQFLNEHIGQNIK